MNQHPTLISPNAVVEAESLNTSDLLSRNRLTIPEYQRDFVWNAKEIVQLWDDLIAHYRSNSVNDVIQTNPSAYFLGAMVMLDNKANSSLDVIDGQQRLIALSCIAAVLRDKAKELDLVGPETQLLAMVGQFANGSWETRVLPSENKMRKFLVSTLLENRTQSKREKYWNEDKTAIQLLGIEHSPAKRVSSAITEIEKKLNLFLADCSEDAQQKRISAAIQVITGCVIVLKIKVTDHSTAYDLFESLNNRGIPLNQADLIKNELIKCARDEKERQQIIDTWGTVRDSLSNMDLDLKLPEFLHYSYLSRGSFIRAGDLFKYAKIKIFEIGSLQYTKELSDDIEALEDLVNGNSAKWKPTTNEYLNDIREVLKVKLTYVTLLAAYRNYHSEKELFDKICKLSMNFAFRFLKVSEGSISALSSAFCTVADKLNRKLPLPDICKYLQEKSSDSDFVNALKTISFKQTKLSYFCVYYLEMAMLEGSGTRPLQHGKDQNLEHIMPKSPSKKWEKAKILKQSDPAEFKRQLWLIGNLMPLPEGINKAIQNKPIHEKISNETGKSYENSNLKSPKTIKDILGTDSEWEISHIEQRQADLANNFALKAWPLSL